MEKFTEQMDMFNKEEEGDPLSKAIILDAIFGFQKLDPEATFSDIFDGVDSRSWSSDARLAEWLTKKLEGCRERLSEEAMEEDDYSDPFYMTG